MSRTQAERPLPERRRESTAWLKEIQRRKCQSQAVLRSSRLLPLTVCFVHQPRAELWVDVRSATPSWHAMLPLRKLGPEKLPSRSPSQ